MDADGNGSLGSNEVTSTHYACNGAGEPGATLNWVAQSEAVTAKSNTGYIATNTSTPVVVTLPDKDHIAVGDVVRVIGEGAGGWKIAQTSAQEVKLASLVGARWTAVGTRCPMGRGGLLGRRQDTGCGGISAGLYLYLDRRRRHLDASNVQLAD